MTDSSQEFNREVFVFAEAKKTHWVKSTPIPLDAQKHPVIVQEVKAICERAGIEPITLYTADMRIPHVVTMPKTTDKSKFVISDHLLRPPFNDKEVAMYIAHKLGHEFDGIRDILSKEASYLVDDAGFWGGVVASVATGVNGMQVAHERHKPTTLFQQPENDSSESGPLPTRRKFLWQLPVAAAGAFVAASVLPDSIQQHNDSVREPRTDSVAVALYNDPEVLHSMLLHMRQWCQDNHYPPEEIYPGINARIVHAERLIPRNQPLNRT